MISETIHVFDNTLAHRATNAFPLMCEHWLNACIPSEIGTPRNTAK